MLCYIHRMSSGGWGTNTENHLHIILGGRIMKRTVRHTLRVLSLAAASALLLAGCSGGGDASEGGDSAGSVTLKIWVQSTNQPEYFQWVKEEFESQNEGIKLKIEQIGRASCRERV